MKKILLAAFVILLSLGFKTSSAQGADPEKVFKYSTKEEKLNEYLKERKWKKIDTRTDEDGDEYMLYRCKGYHGGYLYLAIYPGKFVHYQKFNSEKKDYSPIMTYEDFCDTPEGKTTEEYSITNETLFVKNINLVDHENSENGNVFYGHIHEPGEKNKE
ncbi:MAG: hypothetical protein JKY42_08595 [Flavobacteriales bacterium]|nr:hypothetical protein [Flavobacteriales bacterium]